MATSNAQPYKGVVNAGNLPDMPAPIRTTGAVAWMRDNLFSSTTNILLTVIAVALLLLYVPSVVDWVFFSAHWSGGADACRADAEVACWPFVAARWEQFLYGYFDVTQRWRVNLWLGLLLGGIALLVFEKTPGRKYIGMFMVLVFPFVSFFLLYGNETLGLKIVDTQQWGGFTLTLVIALTGIVASLPIGIVLALGRRSEMPVIRLLCTIFIEFWRGIPLVAVLFMASIMFPLFLPRDPVPLLFGPYDIMPGAGEYLIGPFDFGKIPNTFDQLIRAIVGVALFASAYMAEVVRGGLQAIPKGQYEGAKALGLPYWKMMRLIIMPQALKIVIPGIVNTFIGLFKDTTLVLIIGLFDLLNTVQAGIADPNWSIKSVSYTGYVFVAIVFWICCYGMARYSRYLEEKLHTGHKR